MLGPGAGPPRIQLLDAGRASGLGLRYDPLVRACLLLWALMLGILGVGCALDRDGLGAGGDGGGRADGGVDDSGRGDVDGGTSCVDASDCEGGLVCVLRECVDPASDADMDGVPTDRDCDDGDPSVGMLGERGCSSSCADGLERCTDGVWGACDAPTTCDCTSGETRSLSCAMCGTRMQTCSSAGMWEDDGGCTGAGPCVPGSMESIGTCGDCGVAQRTCNDSCTWDAAVCVGEGACTPGTPGSDVQGCGACMIGTQTRTRMCNSSCAWDPYGPWSTCMGDTGCTPGTTMMDSVPCGMCGTLTRTRTCNSSCAFDPWVDGACMGEGVCSPGATRTLSTACGVCSNGTRATGQTCTTACTWMDTGITTACMGEIYCVDRFGNPICPGSSGSTRDGCSSDERRWCMCSSTGTWTSCGGCFD
jgi:hypothetical protein